MDGEGYSYHVVTAPVAVDTTAILDGFVITGGNASGDGQGYHMSGGGMVVESSSGPTIIGCVFRGNSGYNGGGLAGGSATIINCVFLGNTATSYGGGMTASQPQVINTVFSGNTGHRGGGIASGSATLTNCTFSANHALSLGGGAWVGNHTYTNCVFWGNWADERGHALCLGSGGTVTVSFSDVQGGESGIEIQSGSATIHWEGGNIVANPLFVDADGPDDISGTADDDLRLQQYSPCIDAGNNDADTNGGFPGAPGVPGADFDMNLRRIDDAGTPDTGAGYAPQLDMGAFEFGSTALPARLCVNEGATGARTGVDWPAAFDSLQGALRTALVAGGRVAAIWVAQGTYEPSSSGEDRQATFHLTNGTTVYGGFIGDEDHLYERDPVTNTTWLNGDLNRDDDPNDPNTLSDNSFHVATACGTSVTAVLDGFTITGGNANSSTPNDRGAGVYLGRGHATIRNCVIVDNTALAEAGGIYSSIARPHLDGVTIGNNTGPVGDAGVMLDSQSYLQGTLSMSGGSPGSPSMLDLRSSQFDGPGHIVLGADAALRISAAPYYDPVVIRCDVSGLGDIVIDASQQLNLEDGAVVDLSGQDPGDPNGPCVDPNSFADWGTIHVDGTLICRDSRIQNTNVEVNAGDLADGTVIYNNEITLPQNPPGWGGEFFCGGQLDDPVQRDSLRR